MYICQDGDAWTKMYWKKRLFETKNEQMMKKDYSKTVSIAIIAVIYAVAGAAGMLAFGKFGAALGEPWALLAADVIATVIVWGFGIVYENVSVYDPYWSVAPPVMFTAFAMYKGCWTLPVVLLLIAVWYWGIRLTYNWARPSRASRMRTGAIRSIVRRSPLSFSS